MGTMLYKTITQKEVANIISNKLGVKVELIPRVNKPDGVHTPDY